MDEFSLILNEEQKKEAAEIIQGAVDNKDMGAPDTPSTMFIFQHEEKMKHQRDDLETRLRWKDNRIQELERECRSLRIQLDRCQNP